MLIEYKCHVCGITMAWQPGCDKLEHICQLCYMQRKEKNDRKN